MGLLFVPLSLRRLCEAITTNRKETKHEDIGTCNNLRDHVTLRMRNKDTLHRPRRNVRIRIRNTRTR